MEYALLIERTNSVYGKTNNKKKVQLYNNITSDM